MGRPTVTHHSLLSWTRRAHFGLLVGLLFGLSACAPEAQKTPVDLLLLNGTILPGAPGAQEGRALAVKDGRIVAVGGPELAERFTAAVTRDLEGQTVLPGFDDVHSHIHSYARRYVPLQKITSIEALKAAVREKAEALGPGEWVTGYGWSEDALAEGRKPHRDDLDDAAPDNPVLLTRAGGHSAVANSAALDFGEITLATPQPEGGVIERGDDGRLNGIIRERQDLLAQYIPPPTHEELKESLTASLEALLPLGITAVTHASERLERWPLWREIYQERGAHLPRARVQMHWEGAEAMARFKASAHQGLDTDRLSLGAIKIFADGGFTGPAAFTKAPYKDMGDYRGYLNMPEDELRVLVDEVHRAGWQMGIHAIGDAAIEITADALAKAIEATPRDDHRHYLNHFSMRPSDETMAQMAAHGIAIAQQPNFTYTLAGRYSTYLDGWRLAHNNPVKSPIDAGIFVALSSDILPIGPMVGLYAAVTRKGMDGVVYGADEAISLEEALHGYSYGGAWLAFREGDRGQLVPGQFADFIVLNADPRGLDPEALLTLPVEETWIQGERLWQRSP